MNRVTSVETFGQDLRFGARTMLVQRGFSATVLLTLALGIGANTAMFSALNGILFRPLPIPERADTLRKDGADRLCHERLVPVTLHTICDQRGRRPAEIAFVNNMDQIAR